MRLSKLQVVAAVLACLLLSGSAQAQFGKLKSLKDKLSSSSQEDKKPAAAQTPEKGPAGEAKATYAAGVKKSLNVTRKAGATPEATIAAVDGGKLQELAIKVANVDARQFDAVRAYSPCGKLSNFQILSATQMKVSVDLTEKKSGGTCQLYFVAGGNVVFSADVTIRGKK